MKKHSFRALFAALLVLTAGQAFSADKPQISPEVGVPLQAAQKLIQAKQYPEAKVQLAKAEAVPKVTPYESYVINQFKVNIDLGMNDYKGALSTYDAMLASSSMPAAEKVPVLENYVRIAGAAKDYGKMADGIAKYKAAGGNKPDILDLGVIAMYQAGKYKDAMTEVTNQVTTLEAAGKKPSETQLQLWANCALKLNDMNAYTASLEQIILYQGAKKETWADLISRTAKKPGFSQDRLELDMYRIRRATGTFDRPDDYSEATQLALQAGFPSEAQAILNEGFQRKQLGEGADASRSQRLKDLVTKKVADDKPSDAEEKAASAQASGDALINTGFNDVTYGNPTKGLPLMEAGIKKGNLKFPDLAKLHLGYAYLLAGKKDQAVTAFNSLQGTDGSKALAHLWVVHIHTGGGVAAPAQAAGPKKK